MSISKGKTARTTTREPVEGLSFFHEIRGPRGAYLGRYELDFPDESYFPGKIRGYRAAAELLSRFESGELAQSTILDLLTEACKRRTGDPGGPSTVALVHVVTQALRFMARHANYKKWLDEKIAESEESARADAQLEQKWIERSIEARRAKQAARQAAKAEGGAQ
jgi:hypothetical protein